MILVITPETAFQNEAEMINRMFGEGLDLLHIRKPLFNRKEMTDLINAIDPSFYSQLVLHTHYDLGKDYPVSRFHFREVDREQGKYRPFMDGNIISTSVHDITTYNILKEEWAYAFISPFFPSISKKGYGEGSTIMKNVRKRNNPDVKLVALGGINADNIRSVLEAGADGIALLGAVWENNQPLEVFKKCKKIIL
ncbi:thiamine phosphate synthase [Chryseobacterium sp. NRRL B-14859]|uniref:thiamine phosphate synthase n=1 Tax=Chryseobacterium sp. NRRL B-14859 TaxID=1562763 RepID=UPI00339190EE